jgi:hypothetical protein
MVLSPFPTLFLHLRCFTVNFQMLNHTATLQVGSRAPEFALEAANRDGVLTLSGFLRRGVLITEFLRGTW